MEKLNTVEKKELDSPDIDELVKKTGELQLE